MTDQEKLIVNAIYGKVGYKGDKGPRGDSGMFSIRPTYYNDTKITPLEYIKANKLDFCEGNVIKYVTRHRKKNGKEDLIKAITYIEELIKEYVNE